MPAPPAEYATRRSLLLDLRALGLAAGDQVMVHAALRRVGPVLGGPDAIIDALSDTVGLAGTILAYCDWQLEDAVRGDPALHDDIPAFDPLRSRATRANGAFPELLRTVPGARRSANPGASVAALGGRAAWFTADHALDYGYGPDSPLGKLVDAGGKVLMLGAPLDAMTLLHHAEHIAKFPNKRVKRFAAPILVNGEKAWRRFEEYDTGLPPNGLPDDYFATIVDEFLASGRGRRGTVGRASSVLVDAAAIVPFAAAWMERRLA